MAFGEQILDIADDSRNDWLTAKTGRQIPNKELVLRSKLRIEAREFHMSRLHPQTWGDRQKIDLKSDWSLLTDEERRRKAEELIAMIRELREPPLEPPPLVYRWEEAAGRRTGDYGRRRIATCTFAMSFGVPRVRAESIEDRRLGSGREGSY